MTTREHVHVSAADLTDEGVITRNRRGEVTPGQRRRVQRMLNHGRLSAIMWLPGLVGALLVSAVACASSRHVVGLPVPGAAVIGIGLALFAGVNLLLAGGILTWVLRARGHARQTAADLAEQRIAEGAGEVAWGRGHNRIAMFVARVGERRLRAPASVLPLPPGRYRFLYLACSGWLLSAQPAAGAAVPLHSAEHLAVIFRQHGFTPADLEANRAGELSLVQRRSLRRAGPGWGVVALVLGVAGGIALIQLLLADPDGRSPAQVVVALLLALVALAVAAGLLAHAIGQLREALAPGPVHRAGGALRIRSQFGYRSVTVFYELGGVSLELSRPMVQRHACHSVIEGARSRVYYREGSRVVLSLEPVVPPYPAALVGDR